MQYLKVEKVCSYGLAEVSSPHVTNPQRVTFAEGPQI
jgi:hypothetical protein